MGMKVNYSVVKVVKDAMTGATVNPSLVLVKSIIGIFGEVVYSGSKAGARRFLAAHRAQVRTN